MKKIRKSNPASTKVALLAGAAALMTFAPKTHAQSADALINKLVDKGILTVKEAQDLRDEADKDFTSAFQAKTGMPDWVTGYKLSGDFRGRYDEVATTDGNNTFVPRDRFRYRLRAGVVVSMKDDLEAGFSIASGDTAPTTGGYAGGGGNPLSNNSAIHFMADLLWKF